jgi:hypothetical protein
VLHNDKPKCHLIWRGIRLEDSVAEKNISTNGYEFFGDIQPTKK